jgi:hypothetical protein
MKKRKSKPYGMANGGRPDPRMLGTGLAAGAGTALANRPQQIASAIEPVASTVAPSAPAGYGGLSAIRDNAVPPADMLARQRRGLKDGGKVKYKVDGGKITGPGGPTDDKAGTYDLSNKEYVLPADTVAAVGVDKLDALRDATHTFVDEKNRGMANGGTEEEKRRKPVSRSIGEGIGQASRSIGAGFGTAARNLEDTRKATLSIANRLPGQVAAPIAGAVDEFGAAVRSGYTGKNYVGLEFEARPVFGQGANVPAAAQKTSPATAPRSIAQGLAQRTPYIPGAGLPSADQVASDKKRARIAQEKFGAPELLGIEGNADIYATSTRKDGKLNSFTGIGDRPNFEQRNPADYQAAVERAATDKANVVRMAANYAAQGDREGAARLARGDQEAAAAVEQAFQQRELRQAALGGNKLAAAMLAQQGENTARIDVANIGAKSDQARLGIAQGGLDLQRRQFESSDTLNQLGVKEKQATLAERTKINDLRDKILGTDPSDPGYAKLVSRYNLLTGTKELAGKDRYMSITGGVDAMSGMKQPDRVFDTVTQKYVNAGGDAGDAGQAMADAKAAIASGKISKDEVNKRLREAGYQTL